MNTTLSVNAFAKAVASTSLNSLGIYELQLFMENCELVRSDVNEARYMASQEAYEAQRKMRVIQAEYLSDSKNPTSAERAYKVDEEHRELEECLAVCKAFVNYCDDMLKVLENKYFRAGSLVKNNA